MEQLDFKDIDLIKTLLQENNLPFSDLNEKITFFVERDNGKIVATGGIESAGKDAIIRSIAVSGKYKGKGLGSKVTRHLLNYAQQTGKEDIYLLTTTADKYFPKFGFKEIERKLVPPDVQKSSQYSTVCPDSAVVMKLGFNQNI